MSEAQPQAEWFAAEAEAAARAGDLARAKELYLHAAHQEEQAFLNLPADVNRTRGIFGISAVSLYYKAGAYEEAASLAHRALATQVPEFARVELRTTLQAIWERQDLSNVGESLSDNVLEVSIRGAAVGAGRAPVELVLDRVGGIQSLLYRVTEWLDGRTLRIGPPPSDLQKVCRPWISQPQAGSYRFSIQLGTASQPDLFEPQRPATAEIAENLLNILNAVSPTNQRSRTAVKELVPQADHRQVILKLIRNIAPDGHRVREIEFNAGAAGAHHGAILHVGARLHVSEALRQVDSPRAASEEVTGTLRALHLDKKWLEVVRDDGASLHCRVAGLALDDVIGPMVNQRVIVRGQWSANGARFNLHDIEQDVAGRPAARLLPAADSRAQRLAGFG